MKKIFVILLLVFLIHPAFSEDCRDVMKATNDFSIVNCNGKYGIVDKRIHKYLLEPKYEFITAYGKNLSYKDKHHEYKKLIFKFKENGKYGLLDANAMIVLPAVYDDISSPDFLNSYKKENYRYLVVKQENNYGVYDYYKKELIRMLNIIMLL